jgi:hypothetical protein
MNNFRNQMSKSQIAGLFSSGGVLVGLGITAYALNQSLFNGTFALIQSTEDIEL